MAKDIFRGGFGRLCWRISAKRNTELQHGKRFYAASGLQEFGKCEETRSADIPYDPGQLFLHKSFLYRGIVLFSWNSSVITHSSDKQKDKTSKNANVKSHIPDSKRMKRNFQQYYMALTDPRDSPYKAHKGRLPVSMISGSVVDPYHSYMYPDRNQMAAMHYLQERDDISTAVCKVSNTDIVNHHDIIPYSSTEELPIANELFKAYFDYDKNKVPACRVKPELNNTIQMHIPWADMDNVVYKETTKNMQVTCIPFFLGASKSEWMYCIRIENLGQDTLQIRQREWLLFCNSTAKINTERGPTVEGQEPVLSPERKCYQYVSIVHLNSPRGSLWGSYTMVRPDGTEVIIRIPRMELRCDDDNKL